MSRFAVWWIRAVMLATSLMSLAACAVYEPGPGYAYAPAPGYYAYGPAYYYGYPHAYYYGGWRDRDRWR